MGLLTFRVLTELVNLRDSFNRENEVAPWGTTHNKTHSLLPIISCYGVLRSIGGVGGGWGWGWCNKRGIGGPDMFAESGNFPHLKGGIRHLNEKWRATIPD